MDKPADRQIHDTISLIGLRAQATAVGLVQLCNELHRVGVLEEEAVSRIKDAIVCEISLTRPRASSKQEFEASLRHRLDGLFSGQETIGERPLMSS